MDLTSDPINPHSLIDPFRWSSCNGWWKIWPILTSTANLCLGHQSQFQPLSLALAVNCSPTCKSLADGFRVTSRHRISIQEGSWAQQHLWSKDPPSIPISSHRLYSLQHSLVTPFGSVNLHAIISSHIAPCGTLPLQRLAAHEVRSCQIKLSLRVANYASDKVTSAIKVQTRRNYYLD